MQQITIEDMHISIKYVSTIPIKELTDDILNDKSITVDTLVEVHKHILKLITYLSNVRSK